MPPTPARFSAEHPRSVLAARRVDLSNAQIKKKKKTVLVDMDGCVCDFDARALALLRERFNGTSHPSGLDFSAVARDALVRFPLAANFARPAERRAVQALFLEAGFFRALEPVPGAINALKEMAAHPGLDVFLCTAPLSSSPHCAGEKVAWVKHHFGENDGDGGRAWVKRLVITSDKSLVRGDWLIDDAPEPKAAAMQPTWEHVWFTQPYNAGLVGKRRLSAWGDWRAVVFSDGPPATASAVRVKRGRR